MEEPGDENDPMTLTEVGAYEAIQSIRERETDLDADTLIEYDVSGPSTATDIPSTLSHQDHMYVQRPKSIKCPQCRRVRVFFNMKFTIILTKIYSIFALVNMRIQ